MHEIKKKFPKRAFKTKKNDNLYFLIFIYFTFTNENENLANSSHRKALYFFLHLQQYGIRGGGGK